MCPDADHLDEEIGLRGTVPMIKKRYRCLNCGHTFEAEVFEKGEAEAKRVPVGQVHCPHCNRTDLREER